MCSGVITRYLCWVDAAQRLPAGSVCQLLEAALQVGDSQAVHYICEELPGVQQLQAAHMIKLLQVRCRAGIATVLWQSHRCWYLWGDVKVRSVWV
jgi:hypothetical protein